MYSVYACNAGSLSGDCRSYTWIYSWHYAIDLCIMIHDYCCCYPRSILACNMIADHARLKNKSLNWRTVHRDQDKHRRSGDLKYAVLLVEKQIVIHRSDGDYYYCLIIDLVE